MADDIENDDKWLYGDNHDVHEENKVEAENEESKEPEENDKTEEPRQNADEIISSPVQNENEIENENKDESKQQEDENKEEDENLEDGETKKTAEGSDKEDSEEDSDDDVNVVIGDIKTSPAYSSLNIKRSGLLTSTAVTDKSKQQQQAGKFTVEEFEHVGTINGVPASDFNLDSLEDKPWRKPGSDITDYFNYGFNEDTWRAYCERQRRLRMNESGVGLAPMNAIGLPRGPVPIMNDNSKYSGNFTGLRKAGPPPGRRMTGSIDVIGGTAQRLGASSNKMEMPKENVIQVMTADRREYSRKPPGFPDMSVPPPNSFEEFQPEYGFNPEPEPFYGSYEPTQDVQWSADTAPPWAPQDIKSLTPGPGQLGPPPVLGPPVNMPLPVPSPVKDGSPHRRDSRDREREISRSRSEKPRDRDRERSHRRERSRSRSRRHKSRSRSPSHRSHRKKKSRRHEDSD